LAHSAVIALDRSARSLDANGHLHIAGSNIAKACVSPYFGGEIPDFEKLGLNPQREYLLLRDPDELAKAAPSFALKPVLSTHIVVDAGDHPREVVAGTIGSDVTWSPPYLQADLEIWDGQDIEAIETKRKAQLSPAYRYEADMTPGTYQGERYDGVMRNISGNHLALVDVGRQGPDVMAADSKPKGRSMKKAPLSRQGVLMKGALSAVIKPKLASDSKVSLDALLAGITAKNYAAKKASVQAALDRAIKGKLAQDADHDDVGKMIAAVLDNLDEEPEAAADEGEETDEEKAERMKREADAGKDEDPAMKPDMVSKGAMDAAIKSASVRAEASAMARFNAVREAERLVEPIVGQIMVAMDSAEAVYKFALDTAGEDTAGVSPAAYGPLVKMLVRQRSDAAVSRPRVAQDSAASAEITKRWHNPSLKVR
jgi:hypothetical protein